ncbi:MAG TPA: hypothetical protein VMV82_01680 [Candidatus Dormibacteraeota bacterium]|nr:hypothetical protein [Candidatus Dormibacteraeota bacterium]
MACTAVQPNLTAREQAHFLYETIPSGLFRVEDEHERIAWRISPEPFPLSPQSAARIEQIGADLLAFYRALNALYLRSARGTAPAFIADYLDLGKPEHIVRLARQNRFKQDLPGVIRPDLLLTDDGFVATELDSIPGGLGFVGAMTEAYCKLGIESIGGVDGMPLAFAGMLRSASGVAEPATAVVVSDESGDYRAEMNWIADAVRRLRAGNVYVCAPQDIVFTEDALFVRLPDGREEKLDVLYRNFELFDLLNIPKQELMLYAARHGRVKMTPPPKAQLEEKLSFALLHHPALAALWRAEMGSGAYDRVRALMPRTWVLDPRPLPPQASLDDLTASGVPVNDWKQLLDLGKSERTFVTKPSGFSELAWGSRGVKIANDLTKEEWAQALDTALASYERTPYVLQRFHKGKRLRQPYFDRAKDEIAHFEGRVRLCPYYFVPSTSSGQATAAEQNVTLGGVLATVAPSDKHLIHGMKEAVMAPCVVKEGGY